METAHTSEIQGQTELLNEVLKPFGFTAKERILKRDAGQVFDGWRLQLAPASSLSEKSKRIFARPFDVTISPDLKFLSAHDYPNGFAERLNQATKALQEKLHERNVDLQIYLTPDSPHS